MRALRILTVVMGVLIVVGTVALVVVIARRVTDLPGAAALAAPVLLAEPAGSQISGIAATADRLAVALHGGGPDRVLLLDPRTGRVAGRLLLTPAPP